MFSSGIGCSGCGGNGGWIGASLILDAMLCSIVIYFFFSVQGE